MLTRFSPRIGSVWATTTLLWLGASTAASLQTPTLGEIAKKEEERRKKVGTPSKVFTNKDLPKSTAPAAPAAAAAAPQKTTDDKGAEAKKAEAEKPPQDVKDEAWWRARITAVRTELQRAEMALDAFQSRVNALTNDFAARDDPYQRAQIAIDRQKTLNELERVRSDITRFKQQIADIEEEARVAGVPPGWLR